MKRVLAAAVSLCFVSLLHAQVDAKLADAVKHAKVSLDAGLKASGREGKPISGKFELDEGKMQLSVYTEKANKGFRAVSVVPEEKDSHPVATVTLVKDHETRTATEKLD